MNIVPSTPREYLPKSQFILNNSFKSINTVKRQIVLSDCNDLELIKAVLSIELNLRSLQNELKENDQ